MSFRRKSLKKRGVSQAVDRMHTYKHSVVRHILIALVLVVWFQSTQTAYVTR